MKESSVIFLNMETGKSISQMETIMLDNMKMGILKVLGSTTGLMEAFIKEISLMAFTMERGLGNKGMEGRKVVKDNESMTRKLDKEFMYGKMEIFIMGISLIT